MCFYWKCEKCMCRCSRYLNKKLNITNAMHLAMMASRELGVQCYRTQLSPFLSKCINTQSQFVHGLNFQASYLWPCIKDTHTHKSHTHTRGENQTLSRVG